jgi:hypothetical protein
VANLWPPCLAQWNVEIELDLYRKWFACQCGIIKNLNTGEEGVKVEMHDCLTEVSFGFQFVELNSVQRQWKTGKIEIDLQSGRRWL